MPTLQDVKPGDLITADLMNELVKSIKGLEAKVGAGGNLVATPDVFGKLLPEARTTLNAAGSHVKLGDVYDASGISIDPLATDSRRVLAQFPPPGQLTSEGSSVRLVVGPPLGLVFEPAFHHFQPNETKTFQLRNIGTVRAGAPMAAVSGPDPSAFAVSPKDNNALEPGDATEVTVRFTGSGSRRATFTAIANPGGTATAFLIAP
jgi:hypothetical protein